MLEFLRGRASDRKLRLFAVACCRRIWHLLADVRSRGAVELAERFAGGEAGREELDLAEEAAGAVAGEAEAAADKATSAAAKEAAWAAIEPADAAWATLRTAIEDAARDICKAAAWAAAKAAGAAATAAQEETAGAAERKAQAALLRDLFGNPFRPFHVDPACLSWRDGTVLKMAQAIYDDRAFDRLPILADALEEAGCSDPILLAHLRGPGPHVRGCFAVDALLGKS
jgi:hypothetical protein